MAQINRNDLKSYFEAGDRPTASQFVDLIDSVLNITDDDYVESLPDATTTQKGIVEQATLAEVEAGTDTTRFVTPKGAKRAVEVFTPPPPVTSVNGQTGDITIAIPTNDDSGWQSPTLANGFLNYSTAYQGARFRKKNGVVYTEGLLKAGANGLFVFTLPVGFRPTQRLVFPISKYSNTIGRVDVESNGRVTVINGHTRWFSISGISFLVD